MIKTTMLIPVADNEGEPFSPRLVRSLEQRLLAFGGWSRYEHVTGAWRFQGRVYQEENLRYTVSITSWAQFPGWLAVVRWARRAFRQPALYIGLAGIPEVFAG
ncbi:MAG: hypothetical protein ACRDI2_21660 [Chloroflexota bacterium]